MIVLTLVVEAVDTGKGRVNLGINISYLLNSHFDIVQTLNTVMVLTKCQLFICLSDIKQEQSIIPVFESVLGFLKELD